MGFHLCERFISLFLHILAVNLQFHSFFHSIFFSRQEIKIHTLFRISFPSDMETFLWFILQVSFQFQKYLRICDWEDERKYYQCHHITLFLYILDEYWDNLLIFWGNIWRPILQNQLFQSMAFFLKKMRQYSQTSHS
jgi:hypothetical protein